MRIWSLFKKQGDPRKSQLLEALKENDIFFGDEIAWGEIRAVIEQELRKPLPEAVQFEKPRHPHRYLTPTLWRFVTDKLLSGELHIYRGVLSGRGQSYRSIAEELMSHMIANGDFKASEADDELFDLDEAIRNEG